MAIIPPFLMSIRQEANTIAPHRSKASDGIIGDAAHQARTSDHNPDARGIVHAIDITHDPANGFNSYHYANVVQEKCMAGRETRIKYVVSYDGIRQRDRLASPRTQWRWQIQATRAHDTHMHISILSGEQIESSTAPLFTYTVTTPPPTLWPWENHMPSKTDIVDSIEEPWGAYLLQADGGVRTIRGDFHGSYPGLPGADPNKLFLTFSARVDIPGYVCWDVDGNPYKFPIDT